MGQNKVKLAEGFLSTEIMTRQLERFELIKVQPKSILDVSLVDNSARLSEQFLGAQVLFLDIAQGDLSSIATSSIDMVFSNVSFYVAPDQQALWDNLARVLKPAGLLMFSTLGPMTLIEIKKSAEAVGQANPLPVFEDLHNIGDALLTTGFVDPVMDAEGITLTYETFDKLTEDLPEIVKHNFDADTLKKVAPEYEAHRVDGRLQASLEIVYGHAWAPVQRTVEGEVRVSIEHLKRRR
jgi:malonyl-CoA O-methyltransferase